MNKSRPISQFPSVRPIFANKRPRLQSSDQNYAKPDTEIYPAWLRERKDFQETLKNYENINNLDISFICSKPGLSRSAVEIKALEL